MDANSIRVAQVYELQRVALIDVNYYGARISRYTRLNRVFQIVAALAASGTIAAVLRDAAAENLWVRAAGIGASVTAAIAASVAAVFNFSDTLAKLERLHSSYKMLYHSAEIFAKELIGSDRPRRG